MMLMTRKKIYASNAEKQKAYRERQKNIVTLHNKKEIVTQQIIHKLNGYRQINKPNMIILEQLLNKYKSESKLTKALHNRVFGNRKDHSIIEDLFEFFDYCHNKGDI